MSEYHDIVVWIDRHEAKIFHVSASTDDEVTLLHTAARRRHHQADHEDGTQHAVDPAFFKTVAETLDHTGNSLIVGPGNSKFELKSYLDEHRQDLAARVSGVTELDDPVNAGILDLARRFFGTRGHRHPVEAEVRPRNKSL